MVNNKDLFKNLKKFMSFDRDLHLKSVDEELKSKGLDPVKTSKMGRDLVEELYVKDIENERRRIKEERIAAQEKAKTFLQRITLDSIDKVNEAINSIRQGKLGGEAQRYAQAYFKNFEKATLEDKVSLLKDIELLKHLSE